MRNVFRQWSEEDVLIKNPGDISSVSQARREGGVGVVSYPGPATFGGPCRRPEI